jgi:hypothetical protein
MDRGPFGKKRPVVDTSAVPAMTVIGKRSSEHNASASTSVSPRPKGQGVAKSHRISPRIGGHGDGDAVAKTERDHSVHELPTGGVPEQSVVLLGRDALCSQSIEQSLVNAEGPFFAGIRRTVFVMQIAEVIP